MKQEAKRLAAAVRSGAPCGDVPGSGGQFPPLEIRKNLKVKEETK